MSRASSAPADPDAIVFSSNTHDFLIRLVDRRAARKARAASRPDHRRRIPQRAPAVRALGGGGLDRASSASPPSRSTASPSASSPLREAASMTSSSSARCCSAAAGSSIAVEELAALGQAGRAVGRDRRLSRLHGARPSRSARGRGAPPSTLAAATNMRWPGEGCAFLHAPPGFGAAAAGHRLVRRVRGS